LTPGQAPRRAPIDTQKGWLHQDAVAVLRRIILSGEFPPGERLREVVISERLGVSRTPVREAFRTLAAEGLVDLLPNRSVVVSEVNVSDSADVFAVLGSLEALAGQFACERMTQAQIDELIELQATLERQFETADRVGYTETNQRIHELLVEGSNNSALIIAWRMILPRAQRARTLNNLDRRRWAEAVNEHHKILDALIARDGARLSSLMQEHFDNGVESMSKRADGQAKVFAQP
jgi:DNA-binding GntR family transcriptional regulator